MKRVDHLHSTTFSPPFHHLFNLFFLSLRLHPRPLTLIAFLLPSRAERRTAVLAPVPSAHPSSTQDVPIPHQRPRPLRHTLHCRCSPNTPYHLLTNHQDHAVAGFGAGTFATLVMHPLDLVKVRFQLADDSQPTASGSRQKPRFGRAVYGALADAVRTDGWKGLYRGLVPNLVGGASSWGLYFLL